MNLFQQLKQFAQKMKTEITALYFALQEKETPISAKILAFLTVSYALSPIDLIPDFIPVIGILDDLVVLPLMIQWTIRLIPARIMASCREKAQHQSFHNKNIGLISAFLIVLLWGILFVWIYHRYISWS